MKTTSTINEKWSAYDKVVANCHIANWGIIYIDEEFEQPLEVEDVCYMLEG